MSMRDKLNLDANSLNTLEQLSGDYEKKKEFGKYYCPKCKDKGYMLTNTSTDIEQAQLCDCTKAKLWKQAFAEAGIPKKFFNKTMQDWDLRQDAFGQDLSPTALQQKRWIGKFMTKYIKAIPALCAGFNFTIERKSKSSLKIKSISLVGGTKSGKSLLACIAVQEALKQGLSAMVYDWTELVPILEKYENRVEQDEIAEVFATYDLIVIDSVHNYGHSSPCLNLQLDRLCKVRERSDKPIIITCDDVSGKHMEIGNNWKSLINDCYEIKLPTSERVTMKKKTNTDVIDHVRNKRKDVVSYEE